MIPYVLNCLLIPLNISKCHQIPPNVQLDPNKHNLDFYTYTVISLIYYKSTWELYQSQVIEVAKINVELFYTPRVESTEELETIFKIFP